MGSLTSAESGEEFKVIIKTVTGIYCITSLGKF